jgi:hypothetical protein
MNSGDYASTIEGVRFLHRKELEPVATVWEYQVTDRFSADSARRVFTDLPDGLEISCFDLDEKEEEAYAFIRRVGRNLLFRRGGHGWMSGPEEGSLEQAVAVLLASPFVKRPDSRFESFRVTEPRLNERAQPAGTDNSGASPLRV